MKQAFPTSEIGALQRRPALFQGYEGHDLIHGGRVLRGSLELKEIAILFLSSVKSIWKFFLPRLDCCAAVAAVKSKAGQMQITKIFLVNFREEHWNLLS